MTFENSFFFLLLLKISNHSKIIFYEKIEFFIWKSNNFENFKPYQFFSIIKKMVQKRFLLTTS